MFRMATVILVCTSVEDIWNTMSTGTELEMLCIYIICGWPQNKDYLESTLWGYWAIRHDLAIIDSVAMKWKWIIKSFSLDKDIRATTQQPHGDRKDKTPCKESVYWINMNADIEHMVMQWDMCLKYQQMQPQEKALHYKIPCSLSEVVGIDVFINNNKTPFCIVYYHSKFPIQKKVNNVPADNPVQITNWFCRKRAPKEDFLRFGYNFTLIFWNIFAGRQTFSKQSHHHTTTRAMKRSKHVSNLYH